MTQDSIHGFIYFYVLFISMKSKEMFMAMWTISYKSVHYKGYQSSNYFHKILNIFITLGPQVTVPALVLH